MGRRGDSTEGRGVQGEESRVRRGEQGEERRGEQKGEGCWGGSEVREEEVNGLKETEEKQKEGRKQGGNETTSTKYTLGYGYLTSPLTYQIDHLKVAYTTCRLPY